MHISKYLGNKKRKSFYFLGVLRFSDEFDQLLLIVSTSELVKIYFY